MAKKNPIDLGATQTANGVTFDKTQLPGLTPVANNSIQSILVGILLKMLVQFSQQNRVNNNDETIIVINDGFTFRTETNNGVSQTFKVSSYRIQLYSLIPDTSDDPDNY